MTQLYINGIEAVLPTDFSIAVKRENPLFTKNGEYTYDITLSLMPSINADLYAHINRLHRTCPQATGREAILVADCRVYCRGTEIVTAWSEGSVTLQIASGNSEVNYLMGGDTLISSLAMTNHAWQPLDAQRYITELYPQVPFNLCPVYNENTDLVLNDWAGEDHTLPTTDYVRQWMEQPYLMAYIREVLRALGYDLVDNQLEQTPLRNLYIVNIRSHRWADMLPGWTVLQFIEAVERLADAVFVFDNRRRQARLLLRASYYAGCATSHVRLVEDAYTVEVEQDPEMDDNAGSNIAYKTPDNTYFRYRILSDAVKENARQETIPSDFGTEADRIGQWFADTAHQQRDTLYTDQRDGNQYIWVGESLNEQRRGVQFDRQIDYLLVNEFAPIVRSDASAEVELEAGPTRMERVPMFMVTVRTEDQYGDPVTQTAILPVQIPSASIQETEESTTDLKTLIEGGATHTEASAEYLPLAFYAGLTALKESIYRWDFPLPYTDTYREMFPWSGTLTYARTNDEGATLRLTALDRLLYQGGYDIDFHTQVKVRSHDPNLFDPRTIFEIRNKRYVCKEMEYTIGPDGRNGPWQGTFYPITIDDTSAGVRWILTDGKWRDGGVWLDNGRWLDS